jgi:hypothetical protein
MTAVTNTEADFKLLKEICSADRSEISNEKHISLYLEIVLSFNKKEKRTIGQILLPLQFMETKF